MDSRGARSSSSSDKYLNAAVAHGMQAAQVCNAWHVPTAVAAIAAAMHRWQLTAGGRSTVYHLVQSSSNRHTNIAAHILKPSELTRAEPAAAAASLAEI